MFQKILGWDLVGFCQITSGIILVIGVLNINRFFTERNAKDFINTAMLLRHASAFGLYLFSVFLYYGGHTLHSIDSSNNTLWNIFLMGGICGYIGGLVAQLFLCAIFWDLGKKVKPVKPGIAGIDEEDIIEITEDVFDEDAELQANIWNSLVRKGEFAENEGEE